MLEFATKISKILAKAGARPLAVGGYVRDNLLGYPSKDIDLEVFGMDLPRIQSVLEAYGYQPDLVGASFGVLKVRDLDIAVPRRETKTGSRHSDFHIESDPHMSLQEAAERRDITINAIYQDLLTGQILDPVGGLKDLQNKVLRHVSPRFSEDPLRVLRVAQFAARFEFSVHPTTVALCAELSPKHLPKERINEEWRKLLVKGSKPSLGLNFLKDAGWTVHFPELHALIGCPQDPVYHPEGDVWNHTCHCLDYFAKTFKNLDPHEKYIVGLGVLCHDFGKPLTTEKGSDGRWHAYRHEELGWAPAKSFLTSLTDEAAIFSAVQPLVQEHMRPNHIQTDSAMRRLAVAAGNLTRLFQVSESDHGGRPPLTVDHEHFAALYQRATDLNTTVAPPLRIIQGRDLIQRGQTPGIHFKQLLEVAYEAQLEGELTEDTKEHFLDKLLEPTIPTR